MCMALHVAVAQFTISDVQGTINLYKQSMNGQIEKS